jgi:hypothetical protein
MISKQKREREASVMQNLLDLLGMPVHYTPRFKRITSFPYIPQGTFYVVDDDVSFTNYAMLNSNVYVMHQGELLDQKVLTSLLKSEISNDELELVINGVLKYIAANPRTDTLARTEEYYRLVLNSISGLTIYERIMNGETIRVKLKEPTGKQRKKPFTVYPLHLMSDTQYVTKSSVWFKFSHVEGIRIGTKRTVMTVDEMIWWCDQVEEVIE